MLLLALHGTCVAQAARDNAPGPLEIMIVTPTGGAQPRHDVSPRLSLVDRDNIALAPHTHAADLRVGLPGVWLTRGSGQEHLTALRSPVLTGPGSCGAFLYLADGVPVRPPGLCNVNQAIELNTLQAAAVEVLRGPGPVLYGSNALHGVFNVVSPRDGPSQAQLTGGPEDFLRGAVEHGFDTLGGRLRVRANGERDNGWRADSGYGQGKLNLDHYATFGELQVTTRFAATLLNQETAGLAIGEDAYADPQLARANLNPEAYRDADSQRLGVRVDLPTGAHWQFWARRSAMDFLQHFLPGQPVERNGQRSMGAAWRSQRPAGNGRWRYGVEFDAADIYLREFQPRPLTSGSAFLQATRPVGAHYDFDVRALQFAGFVQRDVALSEALNLSAGVRVEHVRYAYDNALEDGNNAADGQPCGFGGCLYTRPADRNDTFINVAPKLAMDWRLGRDTRVFASLARGFRAPQVTELYRLQSGQNVADLDAETLDSLDIGLRYLADAWRAEVSAFVMRKDNLILRDAEGFNVSNGRSDHDGVELDMDWSPSAAWRVQLSASYARHRYAFDRLAGAGERIVAGNDIDTAPRTLASLRVQWRPGARHDVVLDWEHTGAYYLDAANEHDYDGHNLLHASVGYALSRHWHARLGLRNVLDEAWAERGDFAFGTYRYTPGRPRSVYLTFDWNAGR